MSDEKSVVPTDDDKFKYQSRDGQDVLLTPTSVRKHLVNGTHPVSDTEVLMFMSMCQYQGLNPFLKEAYLIKYAADKPASIVTARVVYEKRAAENDQYEGMTSGIIVEKDGDIKYRDGSFHLKGETIVGGWAEGHRKDWDIPRRAEVSFAEYDAGQALWKSKPGTMIEKVAIVQCLRSMFPKEMHGLYGEEELAQQEIDVTPVQESPAGKDHKEAMRARLDPTPDLTVDKTPIKFVPADEVPKSERGLEDMDKKVAEIEAEIAEANAEPSEENPQPSLMDAVEAKVEENREDEPPLDIY